MKKLFLLAVCALVCISPTYSQTNISSCQDLFLDSGGESLKYINNESSQWLICPDDDTEYLELEFTYVDIEAADDMGINNSGCRDMLYIYDGMDATAPMIGNYCGQESTDGKEAFVATNTLKVGDTFKPNSTDGCFYLEFVSDSNNARNGWNATVSCCTPSLPSHISDGVNCPTAINDGVVFDFTADLSCMRRGNLQNFTNYVFHEFTPQEALDAEAKKYKIYHTFTAAYSGFTEIDIDTIDQNLGELSFYVLGPLQNSCPQYTGGYIADAVSAIDPNPIFFNMSAGSTYMIIVASDEPGEVRMRNTPNTVSLPIDMLTYDISKKNEKVILDWTTTNEVNNAGFEIMRSYDNVNYKSIAKVDATNRSSEVNTYQYIDRDHTASGNIYYYIRQYDIDGTTSDYDVLTVRYNKDRTINAYPNPVKDQLFIESSEEVNQANVTLIDAVGRVVLSKNISLPSTIDVSSYPMGIYTLRIESNNQVQTMRQVIR